MCIIYVHFINGIKVNITFLIMLFILYPIKLCFKWCACCLLICLLTFYFHDFFRTKLNILTIEITIIVLEKW
jgi:hypothetical protein